MKGPKNIAVVMGAEDDRDEASGSVVESAVVLDKREPMVGARVPTAMRDKIDALRSEFRDPDGRDGTRSEVLRAMLSQAEAIFDPDRVRVVRDIARARGWSMNVAWSTVIDAGIAALSEAHAADTNTDIEGGSR